jgi:uncharacterized protein
MSPDLAWETSAGNGSVYSYTTIWRPQTPEFATPYVVAVVQLDEGYSMIANVVGCDDAAVSVGMPVQVEFHPISNEITLPYFAPRTS